MATSSTTATSRSTRRVLVKSVVIVAVAGSAVVAAMIVAVAGSAVVAAMIVAVAAVVAASGSKPLPSIFLKLDGVSSRGRLLIRAASRRFIAGTALKLTCAVVLTLCRGQREYDRDSCFLVRHALDS